MKRHTNDTVLAALNDCIDYKWSALARYDAYHDDGRLRVLEPDCALCELFYNNLEHCSCAGCPLHLMMVREGLVEEDDECSCSNNGTPYRRWSDACKFAPSTCFASLAATLRMRALLLRTRDYFFGHAPTYCTFKAAERNRAIAILLRAKSLLSAHEFICIAIDSAVSVHNEFDSAIAKKVTDFIQQAITDDCMLHSIEPVVSTLDDWLHHIHGIPYKYMTAHAMLEYRRECIDRMIHQIQTQGHISR